MIDRPTTPQLVDVVRAELAGRIAPAIEDPATRIALDMVLAILKSVSVRSAHEIDWMKQEAEQILATGRGFVEAFGRPGPLTTAIAAFDDAPARGLGLAEVCREYELASEVLSACAELAYSQGTPVHREQIREHFDHRLRHEDTITGGYEAVGRT